MFNIAKSKRVDKLIRIEMCYITYKGETYTVNKNAGVVSKAPYKIPPLFLQFTVHKNWMNESIKVNKLNLKVICRVSRYNKYMVFFKKIGFIEEEASASV